MESKQVRVWCLLRDMPPKRIKLPAQAFIYNLIEKLLARNLSVLNGVNVTRVLISRIKDQEELSNLEDDDVLQGKLATMDIAEDTTPLSTVVRMSTFKEDEFLFVHVKALPSAFDF